MPEKTSEIKAVMEKPFKLQPNSFEISQIISFSEHLLFTLILLNNKLFKRCVSRTADFRIGNFLNIAWTY